MSTNVCCDCGDDYEYNSSDPLGASSVHCARCRKKNTKFNNASRLFAIAGAFCRKCGYSQTVAALCLFDAINPINPVKTQAQKEAHAKKQFTLCLNCKAEVESGEYEMHVTSTDPIEVEFYLREVKVIKTKLETYSHTLANVEVIHGEKEPENLRRVSRVPQGIDG